MLAPRESTCPPDIVIMTVDIADSPLAELLLSEIYDVETSTLLDGYSSILRNHIIQQLEATTWLDDQKISSLSDATFRTFIRKENGDILSLRKPALQRKIGQILRSRADVINPIIIPLLVRFMIPGLRQRSLAPLLIPSVVSPLVGAGSNMNSISALPAVLSPTSHQDHCNGCDSYYTTSVPVDTHGSLTAVQSRQGLQSRTQCSTSFVAPTDGTFLMITRDGFATSDDNNDMDNSFDGGYLSSFSGSNWNNIGEVTATIDNKIPVEIQRGGEDDTCIRFVGSEHHQISGTATVDSNGHPVFGTPSALHAENNTTSTDRHVFDHLAMVGGMNRVSHIVSQVTVHASCYSNDGVIIGKVTDDKPHPLYAAPSPKLICFHADISPTADISLTDPHGKYCFAAIEPGDSAVVLTGDVALMPTTASNVQYAFTELGKRAYNISTEAVYVCITVTKTKSSYGFHLHTGGNSGIHRLPFPSLLTRYQPIDRGRCHPHKLL